MTDTLPVSDNPVGEDQARTFPSQHSHDCQEECLGEEMSDYFSCLKLDDFRELNARQASGRLWEPLQSEKFWPRSAAEGGLLLLLGGDEDWLLGRDCGQPR